MKSWLSAPTCEQSNSVFHLACHFAGLWVVDFEVRTTLPSKKEARLMFFQNGRDLVIVNGFIKKTQKTPGDEIAKARENVLTSLSNEQWISR